MVYMDYKNKTENTESRQNVKLMHTLSYFYVRQQPSKASREQLNVEDLR